MYLLFTIRFIRVKLLYKFTIFFSLQSNMGMDDDDFGKNSKI